MAKNNKVSKEAYNKFLKIFRMNISPGAEDITKRIRPTEPKNVNCDNPKDIESMNFKPIAFSDDVNRLFEWFLTNSQSKKENWQNRMNLWEDMYLLALNSPYVSKAIELIADEVVQVDSGSEEVIQVEAKRDQKKFIMDFFRDTKIYSKIRPAATNIAKYGNDLWVLAFDECGVSEIIPITMRNFQDRLEFTPYKVEEEMYNNKNSTWHYFLKSYATNVARIDQMIKSMTSKDDVAYKYKSYLFGYVVGNNNSAEADVIPPWKGLHFRNFTSDEPFFPFGMPLFIYSLAPYNQLDAIKTMLTIARGMMFPKHVYKIKTPNAATATEKFEQAAQISNLIQNSGLNGIKKEDNGLGSVVITIDELYEFTVEEAKVDLGKMEDLEIYVNELIVSLYLPRNMVDPDDGGFGDSGVALIEKWKPFARLVYRIQQIILEQISQLVKIHMIQSRKFELKDIDFTLSMPFPESQTNDELINNQRELMELATEMIDTFSEKFFDGEPVPEELVKMIYAKFLPYDSVTLDSWNKVISKEKKRLEKENALEDQESTTETDNIEEKINNIERIMKLEENFKNTYKIWDSLREKLGKNEKINKLTGKSLKEKIENFVFDFKQESLKEGKAKGRHYYSSRNLSEEFNPADLIKLDKEILKEKFKNTEARLDLEKQEKVIKYKFDEDHIPQDPKKSKKKRKKKNGK
jgi:hypothetical protein